MRIVGTGGTVWAAWHVALSLGTWSLSTLAEGWQIEAEITSRDAYWSQQSLTRIAVHVAGRIWRWTNGRIHVDGDRVTAVLPGQPDHL